PLAPSPGGGGSPRMKFAAGGGEGLSTRTVPVLRDHPTPSHISPRSIRADPPPPREGKEARLHPPPAPPAPALPQHRPRNPERARGKPGAVAPARLVCR